MVKPIIRTAYGGPYPVGLTFKDKSRAIQSAKDECDINTIMAKWQKTGLITHGQGQQGVYGDLVGVPVDYHESMNAILAAQDAFASLPSTVRKKFDNDPAEFLAKINLPENRELLVEMGLLKPTDPDAAPAAPPTADPVPPTTIPTPAPAGSRSEAPGA